MTRDTLLIDLESQARNIAAEERKHDPDSGIEAMARWISDLEPEKRVRVLQSLSKWVLDEPIDEWRARAALLLAAAFQDDRVVDAAVARLRRDPLRLQSLQLDVIDAVSRFPAEIGVAYLQELARGIDDATMYAHRRAAIRAAITLCFLSEEDAHPCLSSALQSMRSWSDPALERSALGLLHSLFVARRGDGDLLRRVLLPREFDWLT